MPGTRQLKVSTCSSFESLPESARALCSALAQDRWFDSLDWFACLHGTAMGTTVQLRVYVVSDERGEALACLFCCVHAQQPRELASLTNYYTMEFGPIVKDTADAAEACAALARHIGAERPRWHSVRLDYLKDSGPATSIFIDALGQHGLAVHRHHQYQNWYLDCRDTGFDAYYASRPSRLRNTIERKGRKLQKTHQVEFVLYRSAADDLERGVRDYVTVYNSSWKQPEPHPEFMPELARRLAARNGLRLGVLYLDGKPVAAQFWITTRSEACIYKLAYDEQYAEMSVGALLSRDMFKLALDEDKVPRIDYGVGSEAYKREWMSAMQEIFGIRAYSTRTVRGRWLHLGARLRAMAKKASAKLLP
ncbi:MAG: GNAT family N-acetyltransferase [Steroidobacteraceae bacterium]